MIAYRVPLIIRGRLFEGSDAQFGGRRPDANFATPDVRRHLDEMALSTPSSLADLYRLSFPEILEYLAELGARLDLKQNAYLQEAFELSCRTSGLTEAILRNCYENIGSFFRESVLRDNVERTIGVRYLEGWVSQRLDNGCLESVRAFGCRSVHIIAGNVPGVAALSIARNAVTRSDAIIKSPSNDPLTGAAIARTMIDLAPDHPISRHVTVAYWKGGDEAIESVLYQPKHVEKIIAWGGFASIKHITKYIQPGIDLVTLDPKLSSTIIGRDAFSTEAIMREVAEKLANDVGVLNQEACVNARVVYVQTGTDTTGVDTANRFGTLLFAALQAMPPHVSGPAEAMAGELADEIESLKLTSEDHKIIGGGADGAVLVSRLGEPVEFARILANRVANLVPFDSLDTPIRAVTAYTQTIGIFPESLKSEIRDRLIFHGAQRLVSLGYATQVTSPTLQDGIEPLRRMCKWVTDESWNSEETPMPSRTKPGPRAQTSDTILPPSITSS
jgi:Acyl-CoA reductase (LuxC)